MEVEECAPPYTSVVTPPQDFDVENFLFKQPNYLFNNLSAALVLVVEEQVGKEWVAGEEREQNIASASNRVKMNHDNAQILSGTP